MRVIEKKIEGKCSQDTCEDALVQTDFFVAVIDGVTSKSDFTYGGKTTGKIASELVKEAIMEAEPDEDCRCLLTRCNQKFHDFYENVEFPYDRRQKGLQAVAAIYSSYCRRISLIGDCQVMVDGRLYLAPKKSDEVLADFRGLVMQLSAEASEARSLIEPWILEATKFANDDSTDFGYSVINGEEIPESLIQTIQLDARPHEIILTSDGYPTVLPTLLQSEAELARLLQADPQCCTEYCSTKGLKFGNKSFDDRTYIRFEI